MSQVDNTEFVDSPEEKKEIEEALRKIRERRKGEQPKKRFKWTKKGIILFKLLIEFGIFLGLMLCIYFLFPLATNIPVSFINSFSATSLLYIVKTWIKR